MTFPAFSIGKTLLSFHPGQDLNRLTLHGPNNFEFVLFQIGEPRHPDCPDRCNRLAAELTKLWDRK